MKYLILGSEGLVGHALTDLLESDSHKVLELDIVNSAEQDLRIVNNQLLESYVQECDFVFF